MMVETQAPPEEDLDILLVEDSSGDVRLTTEALREGKITNRLHVVRDGEEAMDFLRRRGRYVDAPRPGIVLLDLNLPRKDGREVLDELKRDPELHRIPVIVLTTSSAEADVMRSYDLHANCFITKPIDYQEFIAAVQRIEEFWLKLVRLPRA